MFKRVGVLALMLSFGSMFLPSNANAQDWRGRDGSRYGNGYHDSWRDNDRRDHARREWRQEERRERQWREEARRDRRFFFCFFYNQPSYGFYYSTPNYRCPY